MLIVRINAALDVKTAKLKKIIPTIKRGINFTRNSLEAQDSQLQPSDSILEERLAFVYSSFQCIFISLCFYFHVYRLVFCLAFFRVVTCLFLYHQWISKLLAYFSFTTIGRLRCQYVFFVSFLFFIFFLKKSDGLYLFLFLMKFCELCTSFKN